MNKRLGPLKTWQWGIAVALVVVGCVLYRKRQQDRQNAQAPLMAVGPGSYGMGTITGYPEAPTFGSQPTTVDSQPITQGNPAPVTSPRFFGGFTYGR